MAVSNEKGTVVEGNVLPAPRPANSVLDNAALRLSGVPLLRDFREPLAELVARLNA